MLVRFVALSALALALACGIPLASSAEQAGVLTLNRALQRAVAGNPKLAVADREIGIATGKRIQAGAIPNPEISFELDNAFGTGDYRGLRSAETTVQLSQAIELGGKRDARIAAGSAGLESARWQHAAVRLEILSDTAVAFFNVLAGQRKVQLFDAHIASLERLTPLLQQRVDAGASSPGEIARINLAIDLVRVERERARTELAINRRELAMLMGDSRVNFSHVAGDFSRIGTPPAFAVLLRGLERNPQLIRWTAERAQRDAELLSARLKPIPDLKVALAWRHFRDTNDNAVRIGASIPIPIWDQNLGGITEAQAARAKVEAERAVNKASLILALAKAYDMLNGALREIALLRNSAIPNAEKAVETFENGYSQGRFTLLEVLDARTNAAQAVLREQEALTSFHTSVATIEGLTGIPLTLTRERAR
jgi:cobalt-zinc-cadmium efflux system outer membrane protein